MSQQLLHFRDQHRAALLTSPAQVRHFPDRVVCVITEKRSVLLVREPLRIDIISEPNETLVWS